VLAFLAVKSVGACALDASGLQEMGAGDDAGGSGDGFVQPPHDATFDTSVDTGAVGPGDDTGGGDIAAGNDVASSNDAGNGDDVAAADTGATADAPAVDACTPTGPEQCTNGIDDNCNGLTDCADPACMQDNYTCVPTPPGGGWAFVSFDPTSQSGCSPGMQTTNVDVDPTDTPAQCSCACKVATAPTCTGNVMTAYGNNGMCTSMGNQFQADGSCNRTPVMVMAYAQVNGPAGSGGMCSATPTTTIPPAGATKGQICSGETKFGAGCPSGQVCAQVPGPQACVAKNGQVACPANDYTTLHFVGNLRDTRGCSNCKCNGTPACALTWNFYSSPSCNGQVALSLHPDGNCQATGGPQLYGSNSLTGDSQNATCGAPTMQPGPTGQVTLDAEQTVCCE
jgi:hypothetical protein